MFEEIGFYREYYINKKFIGIIKCEKDRETIGYYGMKEECLNEPVVLNNKKTIKAGIVVQTVLYPLSGRGIK